MLPKDFFRSRMYYIKKITVIDLTPLNGCEDCLAPAELKAGATVLYSTVAQVQVRRILEVRL